MGEVRSNIESTAETEKPKVLFRAFTVHPEKLIVDFEKTDLVPGLVSEKDPTKNSNEDELGVYMSTNRNACEQAYAHTSLGLKVDAPRFNDGSNMVNFIELPQCGIVVEVKTDNLAIRKPKLTGLYDEVGQEWIADTVPSGNYKIVGLILSAGQGNNSLRVDVGTDEKDLQKAIEKIQEEFKRRKASAEEYKRFLEGLDNKTRMNDSLIKKEWKKIQDKKKQEPKEEK